MAPLILDIEEDKEDTDYHGDDDADNHDEAIVNPATDFPPDIFDIDIGSVDHFGYLWPQKMPDVGNLWLQK
jgi:hypothetical protein